MYCKSNGNADVPTTYKDNDGFALGKWLRSEGENVNLSEDRKEKLAEL